MKLPTIYCWKCKRGRITHMFSETISRAAMDGKKPKHGRPVCCDCINAQHRLNRAANGGSNNPYGQTVWTKTLKR